MSRYATAAPKARTISVDNGAARYARAAMTVKMP